MDMNVLLMPILENRVACNPYLAPTTGDLGEPFFSFHFTSPNAQAENHE